jgi:heat shock protein HslJ
MSDRTWRDTVQVTVDGRSYKGCGGDAVAAPAPSSPIAGEWRILSIAGRAVRPGSNARIAFQGDRVSGNTGCNAFGGSYRFERGFLTAGPLITTKMACLPPRGVEERPLLDLLGQRLSVSHNRKGNLVLTARNGRTLVLTGAR